jgi:putative hemolysin
VSDDKLIDVARLSSGLWEGPAGRRLLARLGPPVERLLALDGLNDLYRRTRAEMASDGDFFAACLRALEVGYRVGGEGLAAIPASGPLVIVANHPLGGLDGVILGDLVRRVRPDGRILGNYLLREMPEMRESVIAVDPFGGKHRIRSNLGGTKEAVRWIRQGGALLTFPSGEVSYPHLLQGRVTDCEWVPQIAGIVRRCQATVLPVFFEGRNSFPFQVLGFLHSIFLTLLLPRELLRRQGTTVGLRTGRPLPWEELAGRAGAQDDAGLIEVLRRETYGLEKGERVSPR